MVEKVPVRVGKDLLEELAKLKVHPRQSYDEVIRRVLKEWKSTKSR
jgi:predicted CopG family antitoxin